MADDKKHQPDKDKATSVQQVDDRGLASSEDTSVTEKQPDSALGGRTATRSGTEPAPNPAHERSE